MLNEIGEMIQGNALATVNLHQRVGYIIDETTIYVTIDTFTEGTGGGSPTPAPAGGDQLGRALRRTSLLFGFLPEKGVSYSSGVNEVTFPEGVFLDETGTCHFIPESTKNLVFTSEGTTEYYYYYDLTTNVVTSGGNSEGGSATNILFAYVATGMDNMENYSIVDAYGWNWYGMVVPKSSNMFDYPHFQLEDDMLWLSEMNRGYGTLPSTEGGAFMLTLGAYPWSWLVQANETLDGYGNIAIGNEGILQNLRNGSHNIAIGDGTGRSVVGNNNVLVGYEAGSATGGNTYFFQGEQNTYIGTQAGTNMVSDGNTAVGYHAMHGGFSGPSGTGNVAVGRNALQNMGDGSYNVAVGAEAMQYGSAGVGNTVVGANAMTANNGNYNAVFGRYALNSAGNSTSNSVFGCNAVSNLQSGSSNTILGYQAGSAAEVLNNVTLIGANAQPSNSIVDNEVTIGDENVTALRAAVTSITSLSDARDKKDIAALPWGLDFVKTLKPVKFTWNTRSGKKVDVKDSGFIAQDLLASETDADAKEHLKLVLDTNPEKLEASAGRLMPVLVKAIQELAAQVEDLKAQLEAKNAE